MATPRRRPPPSRPSRRELLRLDLRTSGPEQIADAIHAVLERADITDDERVQLLASALVIEGLRPYWTDDRTPEQAHEALCAADPELARIIETIAPMLLGRAQVREEADSVIASIEALLGLDR